MTKYRENTRLASLNLSQTNIALGCSDSRKTVNKVLKAAKKEKIKLPLPENQTDEILASLLFPDVENNSAISGKRMPDY